MIRSGDMELQNLPKGDDSVKDLLQTRDDFPALQQSLQGKPLVYLDNAATTQTPRSVIEAIKNFYECHKANVHRGVHQLSIRATKQYEQARSKVQRLLGAKDAHEIVFVRGATEGINLVANSYGLQHLQAGDEVLITEMEHHSNIVPWQMVCEKRGAKLKVAPMNEKGELLVEEYARLLNPKTRMVALAHISNALGTINPVAELTAMAHKQGAVVLIDGAQAVPHMAVDVLDLDCDFYVFSSHKAFGPTGIGALYGKGALLETMQPYQGGGDMISSVTFDKTTYNRLPYKFEAGTPNVAGAIGLGAAIDYLGAIGYDAIAAHEQRLLEYGTRALAAIDGLRIIGTAAAKASVISFVLEGVHPHDIGTIVDQEAIAIRAGHHCAQPTMQHFGVPATARASFAFYNSFEDIDRLVATIHKVQEVFA